jgi:hypothetical protein
MSAVASAVARAALVLAVAVLMAPVASAASAQQESTLVARLDRPTYLAVAAIVDSARVARIPTRPLFDKALEGAAKGSDGPKIVSAVHQLSERLAVAKRGLGPNTSSDEIKAAAGALEVGVSVRDLARLRAASGKRPVTMPLAVLTDLIGRQVAISTATDVVLQLARSGVKDGDFSLYQRNVRSDIDRGADPTAAATTRARGLVLRRASAGNPRE